MTRYTVQFKGNTGARVNSVEADSAADAIRKAGRDLGCRIDPTDPFDQSFLLEAIPESNDTMTTEQKIDAHLAAMHQHNTATLTRWRQEVDARNSLNKSDAREIIKLHRFAGAGADAGMLARSLSALIRAARTAKSRAALMQYAPVFGVTNHPDFII